MYCSKCNAKNNDEAKVCNHCGAKLSNDVLFYYEKKVRSSQSQLEELRQRNGFIQKKHLAYSSISDIKKECASNNGTSINGTSTPSYKDSMQKEKLKHNKGLVILLGIILFAGIFFIGKNCFANKAIKVDWSEGVSVRFEGVNGKGSGIIEYEKDFLDFPKYSKKQLKALQKYQSYVLNLKNSVDKYEQELVQQGYDVSLLDNVLIYPIELEKPIELKSKKSKKELKEIQQLLDYAKNREVGLYACSFNVNNINEGLSNEQEGILSCQTDSFFADILDIKDTAEDKKIIVTGLIESKVIDLDNYIYIQHEQIIDGVNLAIDTTFKFNDNALPLGVDSNNFNVTVNDLGNRYEVEAISDRGDILFTNNQSECEYSSYCLYEKSYSDKPVVEEMGYFDLVKETPDEYELITDSIYKQVNEAFNGIGWQVKDENDNLHTILNYELTAYMYFDFSNTLAFNVHSDDGNTYHLLVNGSIYLVDGTFVTLLNPNFYLVGLVNSDGYVS